jgi:carbonic anhydrase/acetyltransferase-like protein (isoleucine patch superfamily)
MRNIWKQYLRTLINCTIYEQYLSAINGHISKLYVGNTCIVNAETLVTKYSDMIFGTQ